MKKEEVKELLKTIKGAYPKFEINEKTLDVWSMVLDEQLQETVLENLKSHILKSKFEPSISELVDKNIEKAREEEKERRWKEFGEELKAKGLMR